MNPGPSSVQKTGTKQPGGKPSADDGFFVYDENTKDYTFAYRRDIRRRRTINFMKSQVFDNVTTTKTSNSFYTEPYEKMLLFINLVVANTPTDILIQEEVSFDGVNFYTLKRQPITALYYEDAAGNKTDAIYIDLVAPYTRFKATATGTSASNTFTITLDAHFIG